MDEQLETFSVRVKDAAVSLAERGFGVSLFFSYQPSLSRPDGLGWSGCKIYTLNTELRIPLPGRFGRFFFSLFLKKNSSVLRREDRHPESMHNRSGPAALGRKPDF
jgi:hypothetical protein